jgi:hypothetical protein
MIQCDLLKALRGCFKSPIVGIKTFQIPLNAPINWGTLIPVPPFLSRETQQIPENVGFRSSTQPTQIYFYGI